MKTRKTHSTTPSKNVRNEYVFRQIAPPALRKGELRKLEILEATIRCLAKKGWMGTNYESVGQECGMKRPHVAYHYPQWDELVLSAVKMVYATGQNVVGDYLREHQTADSRAHLEAYVEGTFHWISQYPHHAAVITLLWHLATFDRAYKQLNESLKQIGAERVFAICFPNTKVDLSSKQGVLALNIHGMIVGRVIECLTTRRMQDAALVAKQVSEAAWSLVQKRKRS